MIASRLLCFFFGHSCDEKKLLLFTPDLLGGLAPFSSNTYLTFYACASRFRRTVFFPGHGDGCILTISTTARRRDFMACAGRARLEKRMRLTVLSVAGQDLRAGAGPSICATVNCSLLQRSARLPCGRSRLAGRRGRGRPWRRTSSPSVAVRRGYSDLSGVDPEFSRFAVFGRGAARRLLNFRGSTMRCTEVGAAGPVDCSSSGLSRAVSGACATSFYLYVNQCCSAM